MKRTELEELIKETIVEILGEAGLYALKNPADATKGLAQTVDPDDATEKSPQFQQKYKKVAEAEEDDDDAKDEKIKNAQPTKSELKKNASVSKITDALAKVVKDFKATNEEYKKAEGDKKKDLLDKLKDLTEKKKKLEKALKEKEAKL